MKIKIKENSFVARIAAKKLKSQSVALTIGNSIHLFGADKATFLSSNTWVRHELKHVEQFMKYGRIWFVCLYLFESFKKGYYNNKYEVEARKAEVEETVLELFLKR